MRMEKILDHSGAFDIIAFLSSQKEARFTQIARSLNLTSKTVNDRLRELISIGLVQQKVYPTGHTYVLTSKGLAITKRIGVSLIQHSREVRIELAKRLKECV